VLLPNAHLAEIEPGKLRDYVLSPTHPVGRFKARFFGALGYTASDWQVLEADLRLQHLTQPAELGAKLEYGQSWTIRAILKGPNREAALVVSVWFI